MTEPQDPFAAPEPGSSPAPPPPYGTPAQPEQPPYGAPTQPEQPPYGAPAYGAPAYGEPVPYGTPGQAHRNGMGIAALVLGIVAIIPCSWMFFVPAVLAVVFGLIGRGRAKRREATNSGIALTGVILGVVSIVLGAICWAFIVANWDAISRYNDCMDAASGNSVAEDDCARQLAHDLFGTDLAQSSNR